MRYEAFLFTRNQRQDFTAFVRPSKLTNKDVSTIGAMFNYMSDISRLTPEFPGLYCFRLGAYTLLLRHYNSGRTHAGRAIAVIEGMALQQVDGSELAQCITEQGSALNIIGSIKDIDEQRPQVADEQEWFGLPMHHTEGAFVETLLARRNEDRLSLPFNESGLDMLLMALADRRFPAPPFFAFGTNSDVVAQLEQRGTSIDIVSFLSTDRPSFRNRVTNRFSGSIDGYEVPEEPPDPSMSVRPPPPSETGMLPPPSASSPHQLPSGDNRPAAPPPDPSMAVRPSAPRRETDSLPPDRPAAPPDQPTSAGTESRPIRRRIDSAQTSELKQSADSDAPRLMTLREMRDKVRADEEAARAAQQSDKQPGDPLHRLLKLLTSLISPSKPK